MRKLFMVVALVNFYWPACAFGDSDGYYCVGRGYMAYETRLEENPAKHLLHVVRFSRLDGIVRLAPVSLEDFQVHGMRCEPKAVELDTWTTRYSVEISDPSRPNITTRPTKIDRTKSGAANLGHWAKEGVIELEADGVPGEFQLVIARVSRGVKGGVEHYTFTELVRRNMSPGVPRIIDSHRLFVGIFIETID